MRAILTWRVSRDNTSLSRGVNSGKMGETRRFPTNPSYAIRPEKLSVVTSEASPCTTPARLSTQNLLRPET